MVAASVILGFVIYFQNQKSITNFLFLVFTLVSSFWSVANYISYYLKDEFWTLVMVRLVMFFAAFQALSFFLLVYAFPREKLKLPKFINLVVIPATSLVALLTLTPFVFSGVKILPGNIPQPIPAPGILFFAFVAISLVVWGIVILVKGMRLSDGKLKSQYKYLLLGLLMMFFLIILCNFILPTLLGISTFIPLGAVFIFPFIASTSYAIARYELLNIRIVVTYVLTCILTIVTFFEIILSSDLSEVLLRSLIYKGMAGAGRPLLICHLRSVERSVGIECRSG
ncbi:MAG: histidine kinase N-terminal 7TM domain-containing protein, partial [Candidatus Jordarchaeaceae archaeon]